MMLCKFSRFRRYCLFNFVTLLSNIIARCVFGPASSMLYATTKYVDDAGRRLSGLENERLGLL